MKINVNRDALLDSLLLVSGVVGKKQTLPILSNILFAVSDDFIHLTSTDMEIELKAKLPLPGQNLVDFRTTIPGKIFLDIIKSLPDGADISLIFNDNKVQITCEQNKFSLSTIPADTFPVLEESKTCFEVLLVQKELKEILTSCSYAMAEQDVRYYLNGVVFDFSPGRLKVIASDGHRLAQADMNCDGAVGLSDKQQFIMPRKGVQELQRLIDDIETPIAFRIAEGSIHCVSEDFALTSKMIEGNAPNYTKFFVKPPCSELEFNVGELKQSLSRAAIVSNDAFKSVKLNFLPGELSIRANNTDSEQAEIILPVSYQGEAVEIGFNVAYLLDALSALDDNTVKLSFVNGTSSVFLEEKNSTRSLHVVMPIRL